MAVIGEIALNIVAKTNQFNAGMKKAQTGIRRFSRSMKNALKPVLGFGRALTGVGGLGLAGAAIGFMRVAKSIDQVAKDAVRLSVATEQLQSLNFTAGIFGATSADLTKALKKQSKSISEANLGLLTQKRAFDQLGLSADNLAEQSTDKTFLQIASAMKDVARETDQARIAQDIFGRGGQELLTLFRSTDGEIRKQIKNFKEFNSSFSAAEAANVEKFNDELLKLKTAFSGELNRLVIDVSDDAIKVVRGLQQWLREAANVGRATAGFFDRFNRDAEEQRLAARNPQQVERERRGEQVVQDLRRRGSEQQLAKQTQRGLGAAGRGILGTLQGATGATSGNLNKLRDAGKAFSSGLRDATFRELTVGRALRQKSVADATRKRDEDAKEAELKTKQDRFDELIAKSNRGQGQGQQGVNRLIEATSAEGIAAIRKGRRPNEKLEKLSEAQLKELKTIATKLDRQEELQDLL